jgi:hypothetical protein
MSPATSSHDRSVGNRSATGNFRLTPGADWRETALGAGVIDGAWQHSACPSFRPKASKKSRPRKFSRYRMASWSRTLASSSAGRCHA